MKVLVACEYSGRVRDAFIKMGHDAISCDLLPTESPGPHYQGDVFNIINDDWDMMVAHPPCTYLSSSGMHWTVRGLRDPQLTEDAVGFFLRLWYTPIPMIAIENPIGIMSKKLRKPDQYIQPYEYGENASKKTCLWLSGLKELKPTNHIEPRIVQGKSRWENQTDSGQNILSPSKKRASMRSLTYQGWADAMAEQWGCK
jgi:hypothetical protein